MQLLPEIYEFKLSPESYAAASVSPDTNYAGKWQAAILTQGLTGNSIYWLKPRYGLAFSTQGCAIAAAKRELKNLY